jgi:hypothetical protein
MHKGKEIEVEKQKTEATRFWGKGGPDLGWQVWWHALALGLF